MVGDQMINLDQVNQYVGADMSEWMTREEALQM
jgi:hypothetical protein